MYPTPLDELTPSPLLASVVAAVAARPDTAEPITATRQRVREFGSALAADLAGIALDGQARGYAEHLLDAYWSDQQRATDTLTSATADVEVIIGSGCHAAIYAATRVRRGFPRPLVLERDQRAGGTFAMTAWPTFFLNSRNRPGGAAPAGDRSGSLNFLPGAPLQPAHVSMTEYQTNTDLGLVTRLALAQFADVVTGVRVVSVSRDGTGVTVEIDGRDPVRAGRVIDARGLGDPADQELADGATVLTFGQFMRRMAGRWPLRGLRRVAVIGGGDSGKCAVESLMGIAPQPPMAAAELDHVQVVDWYSDRLPTTCDGWQENIRGRYQAIGRHLRPDQRGAQRLRVVSRRALPVAVPGAALVEGRGYDLAVLCTGYRETTINGLGPSRFGPYTIGTGDVVAAGHTSLPAFRVGPHARLPFTAEEWIDGIGPIPANAASIWRTATRTAALAATLPAATRY